MNVRLGNAFAQHRYVLFRKRLYDTTKKARAFVLKFVSARETLHEQLSKWIRCQRELPKFSLFKRRYF